MALSIPLRPAMQPVHFGRLVRNKLAFELPPLPKPPTGPAPTPPPALPKPPSGPSTSSGISGAPSFMQDYASTLDRWYNPWTTQTVSHPEEKMLMRAGQGALGLGAAAGLGAASIAAAPAVAGGVARAAASPVGKGLQTAYKAYSTATTAPAMHATKLLPQAAQSYARTAVTGTGLGMTASTLHGAYENAAQATNDSAQNMARQMGVSDQKVLDEVGQRARGQMIPMAYRALAPSWAGGDDTDFGKQIGGDLGTIAQHNISPSMLRPSQSAVNASPGRKLFNGVMGNPISALSSAVVDPRPSAKEMWNNVPQDQQKQMVGNAMQAATTPGNYSPLAQGMQHIFEPVVQHHQQNVVNAGKNFFGSLVGM